MFSHFSIGIFSIERNRHKKVKILKNLNKRIYYFGNFTKKNSYAIDVLDYATKFWNKDLLVRFNKLDGYLGAIGTLIDQVDN